MSEKANSRSRRVVAALGVAALGAAGLFSATAAQAIDFGNIDPNATGSIIVHKHEHQSSTGTTGAPDGSTAPGSATIDGVEFTVYPIDGVDLTQSTEWDKLSGLGALTGCDLPAGSGLTKNTAGATVQTTAGGGIATFAGLPVGAYLVCETNAPSQVVDRAQPFVVTIPTPYQDGWVYDVNVYPKNGVAGVSKTVSTPSDLGLGTTVEFPVTADVPTLASGDKFTSFVVSDTLDTRLTSPQVKSVTIDGAAVDPSYYVSYASGQEIRVVFNDAGLAWLAGQSGKQVVVTFTGVVSEIGDGAITNQAILYVNDPGLAAGTGSDGYPGTPGTPGNPDGTPPTPETPGTPSNEVKTNWGDARILKTDAATPANGLAGATFEVYAAEAPYAADCSVATPTGNAISVNGQTTFSSNAAGLITIAGLYVSDTVSGDQTQRCYVLKEIAAPNGFVLPTGNAAFTPIAIVVGQTAADVYDASVKNTQQEVPELPLTGAAGQILMLVAGSALIGLAVTLYVVRRSKQAAQQ